MSSPRLKRLPSTWFWIAFAWLGIGTVNATQLVLSMHLRGMRHPWPRLFLSSILSWAVWALASPLIVKLGRRFPPVRWKPIKTWFIHLSACTATGLLDAGWSTAVEKFLHPWGAQTTELTFRALWFRYFYDEFHLFIILYAAILAISYTLDSKERLAIQHTEAARLNEQLSKAQLEALRRQLEPHFLFNSLNAIAALVREGRNDAAVEMVVRLGDLLRRVLEGSSQQEVSLGEEIEFMEKYLEIQRTRFSDRLQVCVDIPEELLEARVPSLILQPIVENAIQHGIAKRADGGSIRIAATRANGSLTMSIYNDGPPLPVDWEHVRYGIGISNVRTRLRSLYGDSGELRIGNRDQGGVEASFSLPFRTG